MKGGKMTEKKAIDSSCAREKRDCTTPRFCTVGSPDIVKFLNKLAVLSGETVGLEVKTISIRRKEVGEHGGLFVLDGEQRSQTA